MHADSPTIDRDEGRDRSTLDDPAYRAELEALTRPD